MPFTSNRRIILIDELRGVAVIFMVVYHLLYSLIYVYQIKFDDIIPRIMVVTQPFGAGMFILISGFSSYFSKNNLKRGGILIAFGLIINVVTLVFFHSQAIYFGILHFLGVSIILFEACKMKLARINTGLLATVSAGVFLITYNIQHGWLNMLFLYRLALPDNLYKLKVLIPVGFPPAQFASADYFPLLPWFALFLIGYTIGRYSINHQYHSYVYTNHAPFLSVVSKNALYIYMAHQPVILILLWLILRLPKLASL